MLWLIMKVIIIIIDVRLLSRLCIKALLFIDMTCPQDCNVQKGISKTCHVPRFANRGN